MNVSGSPRASKRTRVSNPRVVLLTRDVRLFLSNVLCIPHTIYAPLVVQPTPFVYICRNEHTRHWSIFTLAEKDCTESRYTLVRKRDPSYYRLLLFVYTQSAHLRDMRRSLWNVECRSLNA